MLPISARLPRKGVSSRVQSLGVLAQRQTGQQRRGYRDESFGFRKPRTTELPDYTQEQLENREKNAPLLRYVDSLRMHGHRAARIDPLDILQREEVPALDPTRYGLTDPTATYPIDGIIWTDPVGSPSSSRSSSSEGEEWTLEKITQHLRTVYVGGIAYEYMHSPSKVERLWFSHILESPKEAAKEREVAVARKMRNWELLTKSEVFDQFLQVKFPNLKRYGLEGAESMLPALDALFSTAAAAGVEHIVLGMPHRGRLNLLTDLLQYSPAALFHKIRGGSEVPEELGATGDVISHLFACPTLDYSGSKIKVSMLPNPSHLEAISPVVLGKARAKQFALIKEADPECSLGDKVMSLQLHGDASLTGQGVVMESMGLSNLPHFTVGGSVHLVVNIGYTTPTTSARSSLYCSDIAKMINAPVLHVNGDYPEEVSRAMEIAFKYREAFRKDIIVDLIVYRRWGHNELDEPAFTQPQMYKKIRARSSVPMLYEKQLLQEEVITPEDIPTLRNSYRSHLDAELSKADSYKPTAETLFQGQWKGIVWPASKEAVHDPKTGFEEAALKEVGEASVAVPEGFEIHPRLQRHVKHRLSSLEAGTGLDWATAEALAFGSLLREGHDIRISGQDVGRGTFSQRHAMFVDQKTENVTIPLNESGLSKGRIELANSSLSEFAVLGFEYGISWERPNILPIWEAQFGDFFNGAQVIIDTFLSSAETKWLKQSGIVLLLPHGLDGAGPEHSSSRIERMLQLTNDAYDAAGQSSANINMHVAYPTTPAQYFHLLRRQMTRNYRKPLVVAAPKGLLRLPAAASALSEMAPGTRFQPVLPDTHKPSTSSPVKRILLHTGKLHYDLAKARAALPAEQADSVALVRVEELAPFPFEALERVLAPYTDSSKPELVWVQEEPRNQGAWTHVSDRIRSVADTLGWSGGLRYVGRREDAVPAPGVSKVYRAQQDSVVREAFEGL